MTKITRRDLLLGGLGAAGGALGCARSRKTEIPDGYVVPDLGLAGKAPAAPVALQRCESYEPRLLRERLDKALDLIGGIGDLVRGKTVTVKLNLTGFTEECCGRSAERTYHTHPAVTAALCAHLADQGARQIVLVESFYFRETCEEFLGKTGWNPAAIKSAGAQKVVFENTRNRGAWGSYSRLKVPGKAFLYPSFDVNARYEKTDVFISLAKMKENKSTRITLGAKNLIGVLPQSLYGVGAPDEENLQARGPTVHDGGVPMPSGVPGDNGFEPPGWEPAWRFRVPRSTADITRARPIDLVVVDGIETIAGGEGPWQNDARVVEPRLLMVGRNVVCADAVGSAVMGFDPATPHLEEPFPGENHLELLASAGVGTNDLRRIDVRGLSVKQALCPFDKA
jgi:uncharacterized protein (DUF362 family)